MATSEQLATLTYAVRLPVVLKYLGQLFLVLAALTLVPLAVALVVGDYAIGLRYFVVVIVLVVAGMWQARIAPPVSIQANEALAVTALIYVLSPTIMTYPMMGAGLPFLDALFEAVSGVTTTGLSTLTGIQELPRSFLFGRAWMQWYGGLGIVVLSVVLLVGHDVAARRLFDPAPAGENLVTTTRHHARRVLWVYLSLTVVGLAVLVGFGMGGFDALVHTLAAVSTGGFSPYDDSLAALERWDLRTVVLIVALSGAVSLPLYYRAIRGEWRRVVTDPELRALLIAVVVVAGLLVLFSQQGGASNARPVGHALLLGLSAQTTTGFTSLEPAQLEPASKAVLIGSMAVGGMLGSTAGGIKLLRLLIMLKMLQWLLRRLSMPGHAVAELRFGGRTVEGEELSRALLLILVFILVTGVSWITFVAFGYDPLNALFEVVSALGTVGLSTGITAPGLDPWLKGLLCLDMLFGRIEFIALLILFYPPTWVGKRAGTK